MSALLGRIDEATVRAAAALAEALDLAELELQDGDLRVRVVRAGVASHAAAARALPSPSAVPVPAVQPVSNVTAEPAPAGVLVRAPMAGTFYRAPAPGQPVFVDVGSAVVPESVLCIIESMKMMNRIEAERAGRVSAVLVPNGARVQVGQPLFTLAE
jgi:acetyl-CoA carboxylase biotin carboxyl carrier protein